MTEAGPREAILAEITAEIGDRVNAGERPTAIEYTAKYLELRHEIEEVLEIILELRDAQRGTGGPVPDVLPAILDWVEACKDGAKPQGEPRTTESTRSRPPQS